MDQNSENFRRYFVAKYLLNLKLKKVGALLVLEFKLSN